MPRVLDRDCAVASDLGWFRNRAAACKRIFISVNYRSVLAHQDVDFTALIKMQPPFNTEPRTLWRSLGLKIFGWTPDVSVFPSVNRA